MTKYRNALPQLGDALFLTDGGIETTLIFHNGFELPYFAAFDLLRDGDGRSALRSYYVPYAQLARERGVGFILESPTWRANADWASKLGYTREELAEINREAIALMVDLRNEFETARSPMVISGCIGPRGDGYDPGRMMTAHEAETYHAEQVAAFRDSDADMVSAITMNYTEEAVGIARATAAAEIPAVISFTLETDGRLPTGQTLAEAITVVDAASSPAPAYYMINCAHPTHFDAILQTDAPWTRRIKGLRANASKRSHSELDAAPDLDDGDPAELGRLYRDLKEKIRSLTVLGGCCGTDHRHIHQICMACTAAA
ncbi:MAG: homocysteine S-methyltransferase family protein [Mesorhizobium sp.]|jgi:S-methylmethionine-dependent homocysteine/selenocysteine methylase